MGRHVLDPRARTVVGAMGRLCQGGPTGVPRGGGVLGGIDVAQAVDMALRPPAALAVPHDAGGIRPLVAGGRPIPT